MVLVMKNKWKMVRLAAFLFALPLAVTAAASAHQMLADDAVIDPTAVSAQSDALNPFASTRLHTVSLNRAGQVEGRVATFQSDGHVAEGLSKLKVSFVQDGEIVQEAFTDEDGAFAIDGLAEGAYSFVATGQTGFAAYGVRVVPFDGKSGVNAMEAAAVSPNFTAVKTILQKYLPSEVSGEILAATENVQVENMVGSNRIRLNDGQLSGRVLPMFGETKIVDGTTIHVIENDQQVAEVTVGSDGLFSVPDLEPGVYDFVAAGPSGFAAVSFEAIAQDSEVGMIGDSVLTDTDEIPVSIPAAQDFVDSGYVDGGYIDGGYSDSLDVCLTCQQDAGFVGDQFDYAGTEIYDDSYIGYDSSPIEYVGESVGCGCAAGGSCGSCGSYSGVRNSCGGSCGGGGGGGRLFGGRLGIGGLLGLGGLAAGIVGIADDGDGTSGGVVNPGNNSGNVN